MVLIPPPVTQPKNLKTRTPKKKIKKQTNGGRIAADSISTPLEKFSKSGHYARLPLSFGASSDTTRSFSATGEYRP